MVINRNYLVTDKLKHGGKRKKPIRVLIPHHNAGVVSGQNLANYIKTTTRALSATYIIGQKGEVFQGLDESLEPYTTSNRAIDTEAITFEIANSKGAPNWEISDDSFDALVELSIDICKRHGIKEVKYTGDKSGNIHLHKWYASTNCPGPYVESLMPEYARRVNEGLKPPEGDKLYKIQIGAYSVKANAEKALKEAIAKGYKDAYIVETGSVTKPSEPIKPTIREGVIVSIRKGAKSYEGKSIASWVFNQKYRVDELKGDRALLDKQGICTAFNIKDLVL